MPLREVEPQKRLVVDCPSGRRMVDTPFGLGVIRWSHSSASASLRWSTRSRSSCFGLTGPVYHALFGPRGQRDRGALGADARGAGPRPRRRPAHPAAPAVEANRRATNPCPSDSAVSLLASRPQSLSDSGRHPSLRRRCRKLGEDLQVSADTTKKRRVVGMRCYLQEEP